MQGKWSKLIVEKVMITWTIVPRFASVLLVPQSISGVHLLYSTIRPEAVKAIRQKCTSEAGSGREYYSEPNQ